MALENLVELIPNSTGDDNSPSRKHLVEYYARIGTWCNQAREEGVALQEEIPELRDIQQAIDYLMSLQWKENLPSYRAKPVSNEMFQMFWSR